MPKSRSRLADLSHNATATLLVVILILGSALALFASRTTNVQILDCSKVLCAQAQNTIISALDAGQVENLDLTLSLDSPNSPAVLGSDSRVVNIAAPFRQIELTPASGSKRLISVPMRLGTVPYFGYTTPPLKAADTVRIKIVSSRELYIFVNGKIAYSHRYAAPVFIVDPKNPVDLSSANNSGHERVSIRDYTAGISTESSARFSILELGLVTIGILIALLVKKLLWIFFAPQRSAQWFEYPVLLPGGLWVVSLALWLIHPVDRTGASTGSVSPFTPIGAAFSDYFQVIQVGQQSHPYDLGASNYPPLALLLGRMLHFIPNMVGFVLVFSISAGVIFLLHDLIPSGPSRTARLGKLLFFTLSYPLIFALVRGNLDLLAIALLFIGFLAASRNSTIVSVAAFGSAIALKYWPVVFLLVLLKQDRKRIALYSVIAAGVATVTSFFLLGYGLRASDFHVLLTSLSSANAGNDREIGYSFTLRSLLFFGYLALSALNPFNPTTLELGQGFTFLAQPEVQVLVLAVALLLIWLVLRARSLSSSYLYVCAFVLMIPSPTYAYRAVVLIFYIYLRSLEAEVPVKTKVSVKAKSKRGRKATVPRSPNALHHFPNDSEKWWWSIIIAPTTIVYLTNSVVSTASLLQPLALLSLVLLEVRRERDVFPLSSDRVEREKGISKLLVKLPN